MAIAVTLTEQKMNDGSTKLKLASPYSPNLPAQCRALGGKWNSETKHWYFDPRDAQRVRDMCVNAFGIDPLAEPDEQPELVTVRVHLEPSRLTNPTASAEQFSWTPGVKFGRDFWLFGREILSRFGRDDAVRLGRDVILVSGGFSGSGGSRANPVIGEPKPGTVIEIRDVPRPLADEALKAAHENMPLSLVEDAPNVEPVATATARIGALFSALTPANRRAVIISMIGAVPASERPALLEEIGVYVEQGAL